MKESQTTTGLFYLTPAIAPAAKFATNGRAEINNKLTHLLSCNQRLTLPLCGRGRHEQGLVLSQGVRSREPERRGRLSVFRLHWRLLLSLLT